MAPRSDTHVRARPQMSAQPVRLLRYDHRVMPLAFSSLSHGRIAFGFFNIQSDMLLCDRLFFFASRFCHAVEALALEACRGASACETDVDGWHIPLSEHIGDLHGAIDGTDLGGFLGAVYQRFPFPERAEDFKQSPEGSSSQAVMEALIAPFGHAMKVSLRSDRTLGLVAIGPVHLQPDWLRGAARLCGAGGLSALPRRAAASLREHHDGGRAPTRMAHAVGPPGSSARAVAQDDRSSQAGPSFGAVRRRPRGLTLWRAGPRIRRVGAGTPGAQAPQRPWPQGYGALRCSFR